MIVNKQMKVWALTPRASCLKVKSMPTSGTEAIRTQIQPSKPKREINKITKSQNTKRTYGQPREQFFPKIWPLSNQNRTKIIWTHIRWNVNGTLTPKTVNSEPQHNYRFTGCPKKQTITLLINQYLFYITASTGMYLTLDLKENQYPSRISNLNIPNSHVASIVAMETNMLIFTKFRLISAINFL